MGIEGACNCRYRVIPYFLNFYLVRMGYLVIIKTGTFCSFVNVMDMAGRLGRHFFRFSSFFPLDLFFSFLFSVVLEHTNN